MSWTSTYEAVEFGGVALHRMIAEAAVESGDRPALIDGPMGQAVVPFFHIIGFVVNLAAPLASGATLVTMPRFDLERFLALIQEYHVTVLVGAPPIMAALARHPKVDAYDLSSLELIVSGGAPSGADLQRAVADRIPSAAVGRAGV
jgi:acyl-CoA synthetase (AMP-forming)/AMP-acid ligase II